MDPSHLVSAQNANNGMQPKPAESANPQVVAIEAELKKQKKAEEERKKEEDEKAKEKSQDKSRPISSTPVPGTPW